MIAFELRGIEHSNGARRIRTILGDFFSNSGKQRSDANCRLPFAGGARYRRFITSNLGSVISSIA